MFHNGECLSNETSCRPGNNIANCKRSPRLSLWGMMHSVSAAAELLVTDAQLCLTVICSFSHCCYACVTVCVWVYLWLVECAAVWSLLLSDVHAISDHEVGSKSTSCMSQVSCLSTINCTC